jgi:hypothetical protein
MDQVCILEHGLFLFWDESQRKRMPLPRSAVMLYQPAARASSTIPNNRRMRAAAMSRVEYQSPLAGPPQPRTRDIDFQGHDRFTLRPVPFRDVHCGPPVLERCMEPNDFQLAQRFRAQQPVPLDAREMANQCRVSQ